MFCFYQIRIPSGSRVEVMIYKWGMSVYVTCLAMDAGKTYGLCGNFDGDKTNEFVDHTTGTNYFPNGLPDDKFPQLFTDVYRYSDIIKMHGNFS